MKKIFLIFFFLIISNNVYGQDKIVYLDTNYLLAQSEVGKYVNSKLKKINDKNIEEFKKIELNIKSSEENLLKQKNILKKEDYELKVSDLKNKYKTYKEQTKKKNAELNQLRNIAGSKILNHINEILTKYSENKSISLIIEKKNVVIGKTDLDVTSDVLSLLNKKIKKIELQ
jgi:outer membrane protein